MSAARYINHPVERAWVAAAVDKADEAKAALLGEQFFVLASAHLPVAQAEALGHGGGAEDPLVAFAVESPGAQTRLPAVISAHEGLFVGGSVGHYNPDETDLQQLFPELQHLLRTLILVKPDAFEHREAIIAEAERRGFTTLASKAILMDQAAIDQFYAEHRYKPFFGNLSSHMQSGPSFAAVLCRPGAVEAWRQLVAEWGPPASIRARYGTDATQNACHGSATSVEAAREVSLLFPSMPAEESAAGERAAANGAGSLESYLYTARVHSGETNSDVLEETLPVLLSKALKALHRARPEPSQAVQWLAKWLRENNPNVPYLGFEEPLHAAATLQQMEEGTGPQGEQYVVLMPRKDENMVSFTDA